MTEKILGLIAAFILKQYYLIFIRYQVEFEDPNDKSLFYESYALRHPKEKTLVMAFFHQDEIPLIPYFMNKNICALVSSSKDGEIMSTALNALGVETVRGSSNKKPIAGLIAAIKKTKQGYNFAVAADGPRGPIYQIKEGVIKISEKSGFPIVPIRASVSRAFIFKKAWDQAKFPKPFSKVTLHVGKINFYNREDLEAKLKGLAQLSLSNQSAK